MGIKRFRDLNLQNLQNIQIIKKIITKNKIKNFRKTLAYLWADVQACSLVNTFLQYTDHWHDTTTQISFEVDTLIQEKKKTLKRIGFSVT